MEKGLEQTWKRGAGGRQLREKGVKGVGAWLKIEWKGVGRVQDKGKASRD